MLDLNSILIDNLEAGTGTPYFKMRLLHWNGAAWVALGTYEVIQATLKRLTYDVWIQENIVDDIGQITNSEYAIDIERGLTVDGTKYSIVSNDYYITSITYSEDQNGSHIIADLLPTTTISEVDIGSQTLRDMFEDIFDQINSAYLAWDDSRDIWYDWDCAGEVGDTYSCLDARQLVYDCYERLFSYIFPRWYKSILIYSVVSNYNNAEDGQYTPFSHAKLTTFLWPDKPVNLTWESESGTQNYDADGQDAGVTSLGRIKDADDPSGDARFQEWGRVYTGLCYQYTQRPDLNLEQGDLLTVSTDGFTTKRCFELIEYYKKSGHPKWVQVVRQLPYHPQYIFTDPYHTRYPDQNNTSSSNGSSNSGAAYASSVKVNSGEFSNKLDVDSNDVQTALRRIDSLLVTDHGELEGLTDDDHSQYVKDTGDTMTGQLVITKDANELNPLLKLRNISNGALAQTRMDFFNDNGEVAGANGFTFFLQSSTAFNPSAAGFYQYENAPIVFATNKTARVNILASGELTMGITSSPSGLVHIRKTQNTGTRIYLDNLSTHSSALASFHANTDGGGCQFGAGSIAGAFAGGGFIYGVGNYPFNIFTNAAKRLTILGSGEVLLAGKLAFTQSDLNEYIDSLADGYMDYRATTAHRFGDGTNYAQIASDGEITLHGTARIKKTVRICCSSTVKGASAPTTDGIPLGASGTLGASIDLFSKVTQQDVFFSFHVPTDCDVSVVSELSFIWVPGPAWTAGNYMWKLEYLVKADDAAYNTGTPTTISADVTPSNLVDFIKTTFSSTITLVADNTVFFHFYRDVANDNGDDVGGIISFEIEYTANKLGEPT